MDNAGENKSLIAHANGADWKLNVDPEYTACNTPQQNWLAEIKFTHLALCGCAMMAAANVPMAVREKVAKFAFETATKLDWLVLITLNGKTDTCAKHYCGKNARFAKHLCTWGEAGMVTLTSKAKPKSADRGMVCMFIGYTSSDESKCYVMYDPKNNTKYETRDVTWLHCMYYT